MHEIRVGLHALFLSATLAVLWSCSDGKSSSTVEISSSLANTSASSAATAQSSSTIENAARLNDTGIVSCANADQTDLGCPQSGFPSQDGEQGRDALAARQELTKTGGGVAGFDWTKIDAQGEPLAVQNGVWETAGEAQLGTHWTCVLDNVTGLMWEVKESDSSHPRYGGHYYSWYSEDENSNGGSSGYDQLPEQQCATPPCHTQNYVRWLNQLSLCGYSDWRMPSVSELLSISVSSQVVPALDTEYFPNHFSPRYFTRNTLASDPQLAWYVYFTDSTVSSTNKSDGSHLRLVRSAR